MPCVDGAVEERACGPNGNGVERRACADGLWPDWGACIGADACREGEQGETECGVMGNGRQARSCVEGRWQPLGECDDPDECVDDAEQSEACGLNGRGQRGRACAAGRWSPWSACDDLDVCVDGLEDAEACGLNGRAAIQRRCEAGEWGAWGACDDPDECVDEVAEVRPCGAGGQGEQGRACVAGRWSPWAPCEGAPLCPDAENPDCGEPRREVCNGLDDDHDGEIDEGLIGGEEAALTPFGLLVEQALDGGFEYLRAREAETGHFQDETGNHNFLAVLALLERQTHPGFGPRAGYLGLDPDDQALVVRLVRYMIDAHLPLTDPRAAPYMYVTGGSTAALARYLRTGGPDEIGADVQASVALANGVESLTANQGEQAPRNLGGWNYRAPEATGDLSTTHFGVLGLVAAAEVMGPAAAVPVPNVVGFLDVSQAEDGGFGYRPGVEPSSAMTSVGVWSHLVAGSSARDEAVIRGLAWLQAHHTLDEVGPFPVRSRYIMLWYLTKALGAMVAVDDPRFGLLDPAELGFPEEIPGYYFDIAHTLLRWQEPEEGVWGTDYEDVGVGWTAASSHLFALLALERALVGVGAPSRDLGEVPRCADERDNDEDGLVDLDDPQCTFACTRFEGAVDDCRNHLDDDGDGLVDAADLGCLLGNEDDDPACGNSIDDDDDGHIDWPADPGCLNRLDNDELSALLPACGNGEDDDDDGQVDLEDPDCLAAHQDDEAAVLGCEVDGVLRLGHGVFAAGVLGRGAGSQVGSCGGPGEEAVYALLVDIGSDVVVSTRHAQTEADTVLYLRATCDDADDLVCAAGEVEPRARLSRRLEPGLYYLFVDSEAGGEWHLSISVTPVVPSCADGMDNDEDGLIDMLDPGCPHASGTTEVDPGEPAACGNGADDDADGQIDFPTDAGCEGPGDPDEADPDPPADCANGVDDDGDGRIDLADPSCRAAGWGREDGPPGDCANRVDDDGDGLVDHPFDPGCAFPGDSEEDPPELPACSNGEDDDDDGITDFPFEPGCDAAADDDEADPALRRDCNNLIDDDEDELTDFPWDPGCAYAADPDEVDPDVAPRCANGVDEDQDGDTDFPDDRGCRFAADIDERRRGRVVRRCSDELDNDLDGAVDLRDLGCAGPQDDDEADPDVPPECGNDVDDDEDGLLDWPADPGCLARGDAAESQLCVDVASPLIVDGRVVGETREGDDDAFRASCGGAGAPEQVFRYVLEERADLVFDLENPGTEIAGTLSVRRDCDVPASEVVCRSGEDGRTVRIEDAEVGEYLVFVDGLGLSEWRSRGAAIEIEDPRGFVANDDILERCGWADGGGDAFDCFGRPIELGHDGITNEISPLLGAIEGETGGYGFLFTSDLAGGNTWRLRFDPLVEQDARRVDVRLVGNLGSDGITRTFRFEAAFDGHEIPYVVTSDGALGAPRFDPPVLHLVVPSRADDLDRVTISVNGDRVTYDARQVRLPLVMYVSIGYADHADVAAALLSDLRVTGGDADDVGRFELTVHEE